MSLIWIIDDEPVICSSLSRAFQRAGYDSRVFSSAEPVMKLIAGKKTSAQPFVPLPDVIVLDVRLPGMDGLSAIVEFQKSLKSVPVIVMTAFGDLKTAVKAIEAQVFEYMTKPFDLDEMLTAVRRAIDSRRNSKIVGSHVPDSLDSSDSPLLGKSTAMQTVFKRIAMAAASDCPVLICGESGTGKELVARAIHTHSFNAKEPYLAIAPVSLNASLIESELFGHERGAFTGADHAKVGAFELAGKGTILLDEIGDLPLGQQVKLLRVLEQREFIPVGSNKPRPLQARVFAATHCNLRKMVSEGRFREDLYFRLAVFTIEVPSLRQRVEDIIPLAIHFLLRHNYSAEKECLDESTSLLLLSHSWSGNVRELRNAMDHAAILARGKRIYPEHLPQLHTERSKGDGSTTSGANPSSIPSELDRLIRLWLQDHSPSLTTTESALSASTSDPQVEDVGTIYDSFLDVVEPSLIRALLETAQGNRAAVANALGLHRSTLRQKMRRHKIDGV
ncbi:MAG: sigma-54 dependent transcriptional regulator [Planctomycetota bacterium]|nr:sigma-54 dependent transcriptional regulator [Planctomycetota bacterium]